LLIGKNNAAARLCTYPYQLPTTQRDVQSQKRDTETVKNVQGKGTEGGAYWSIPPSLIIKPSRAIQILKILQIRLPPPKIERSNLKITPKMTHIIVSIPPSPIIHNKPQTIMLCNVLRMVPTKGTSGVPESRNGFSVFGESDDEGIDLLVFTHIGERVVGNGAVKVNVGFDTPVPGVFEEEGVTEEEA
jgi:hypothetical protein